MKNKTNVVISGKQYTITSEESGEYVTRCAYCFDKKVQECNKAYPGQGTVTLVSLAGLNMTDDFLKTKDALAEAEARIEELERTLRELQIGGHISGGLTSEQVEIRKLREANRRLEQENAALRQPKEQKVTAFSR